MARYQHITPPFLAPIMKPIYQLVTDRLILADKHNMPGIQLKDPIIVVHRSLVSEIGFTS